MLIVCVCIFLTLSRMERWCVSRCLALHYPASIHPSSMESAVLSVSVSLFFLLFRAENVFKDHNNWRSYTHSACVCVVLKMMKTSGRRGLSGPTARSPVGVEGSKEAGPAMTSSRPVPARQSKPAAACPWSVTPRVGQPSACLICNKSSALFYLISLDD